MTNTKTIKTMYRFFDYLYESPETIGAEVLADWSHKEQPELVYCVIDIELTEEKEFSPEGVWLFTNEADAIEELNEWEAL